VKTLHTRTHSHYSVLTHTHKHTGSHTHTHTHTNTHIHTQTWLIGPTTGTRTSRAQIHTRAHASTHTYTHKHTDLANWAHHCHTPGPHSIHLHRRHQVLPHLHVTLLPRGRQAHARLGSPLRMQVRVCLCEVCVSSVCVCVCVCVRCVCVRCVCQVCMCVYGRVCVEGYTFASMLCLLS